MSMGIAYVCTNTICLSFMCCAYVCTSICNKRRQWHLVLPSRWLLFLSLSFPSLPFPFFGETKVTLYLGTLRYYVRLPAGSRGEIQEKIYFLLFSNFSLNYCYLGGGMDVCESIFMHTACKYCMVMLIDKWHKT